MSGAPGRTRDQAEMREVHALRAGAGAVKQAECAQFVVGEAVREQFLLRDDRPFERLVQPGHRPRLGWDRERDAPDVRQERGAILLAVRGVQSLSDRSCTIGIHRSPIVGEPP